MHQMCWTYSTHIASQLLCWWGETFPCVTGSLWMVWYVYSGMWLMCMALLLWGSCKQQLVVDCRYRYLVLPYYYLTACNQHFETSNKLVGYVAMY